MRLSRIYTPDPKVGTPCQLEPAAAHHLVNVLRFRAGDSFVAFDGKGSEFTAQIVNIDKKQVWVSFCPQAAINRESNLSIHLVQALTKSDKMDYIIQKSVELGVKKITPILTERTEMKLDNSRKMKKYQHWQQIIINACEQCGRSWLPALEPIIDFQSLFVQLSTFTIILHPQKSVPLAQLKLPTKPVALLIGPEGGFSESELEIAKQQGVYSASLGPRILRTETAGLAAIASMQTLWGDFSV